MKTSEEKSAFHALVPLLDDSLLSLREKECTALLLRFGENHSLREVRVAGGGERRHRPQASGQRWKS
ncbi:MAG: hypothetical protein IPM17_09270 [Verrucomicrobia bacterium]|jgi:hypothetical protein|nr:hypothetical protein [Verrucomicrobiota bacterium]